jgi:hypothetical protein
MPMLADLVELARRGRHPQDIHTAAVVQAATGAVVDQLTVPATPAGYRRLLRLADRYDGWRVWAIESPGGDGAGLTRFLQAQGEQVVVELDRPSGPLAATAPSPIPGATRAAREAWAATASPSPEQPVTGRRCRCGWPPGVRRSRRPPTPTPAPRARVAAPDPLRDGWVTSPHLGWSPPAGGSASRPPGCRDRRHHGRDLAELGPPHPPPEPRGRRPHPGQQRLGPDLANRTCSAAAGWARSWPPSCCAPGPILAAAEAMPPSPCWAAPPRSRPPAARRCGCG